MPPLRKTTLWIIYTTHAVFLLLLICQPHFTPAKKEHKTLLVKTITPKPTPAFISSSPSAPRHSPKPAQPVAALPTPQPKKNLPKPLPSVQKTQVTKQEATPPTKKEPAIADKTLSKKKITPPPPPKKETPRAKISEALLHELEESIAKIEQKGDKKREDKAQRVKAPLTLQIDTGHTDATEEGSYVEKLVGCLQEALQLPDHGEVKIQLSLHQDGSVVKIVILKAQSQANKRYLEENLPYMRFPRFEGPLAKEKESSFTLTFVNQI